MSVATRFIPLSEKSIRDSWIGDCRTKNVERLRFSKNTQEMKTAHIIMQKDVDQSVTPGVYLGEFDHVSGVPALLPLFGFYITVGKTQEENNRCELRADKSVNILTQRYAFGGVLHH